jgi:7-dehydrocholesterol reductase
VPNASESAASRFFRRVFMPLGLLLLAPPFTLLLWFTLTHLDGSLSRLAALLFERGVFTAVWDICAPRLLGSPTAWAMIGVMAAVQLVLLRVLPGREVEGPVTPGGHVPRYRANGLPAFFVTVALYLGASFGLGLFSPGILYDHMGELLGALNLFAVLLCAFLYFKGRFAPSGPDHGATGNPLFDFFQGTELYPQVLGWDVKTFTNCRMGMMGWALLVISYAAKQHALSGLGAGMAVSVALQLVYIAKFFHWEPGYWRSLDIMHDRAGFYICWGCLVWLPIVYTGHTLFLVEHPSGLGWPLALLVLAVGLLAVAVNYLADAQRQRVRATEGRTKVWGRRPQLIYATYETEDGEEKRSILLASGFWGLSRHFHYLPELLAAACWTLPVLFGQVLPWFYVIFLTILLTDRAHRDERRCAAKYGEHWEEYKRRVPYRIIPWVY